MIPIPANFGAIAVILASAGAIAATWKQILGFLQRLLDLFICRVIVKNDLSISLQSYIWTRGKRSPFGLKVFGGTKSYVNPNKRIEVVGFETVSSDPMLLWFDKRPIIIKRINSNSKETPNIGGSQFWSGDKGPLQIYFIRGTFDIDKFLIEVISSYNEIHHKEKLDSDGKETVSRFQIIRLKNPVFALGKNGKEDEGEPYWGNDENIDLPTLLKTNSARLIRWCRNDLMENHAKSAFADYPFPHKVDDILQEITLWKNNGEWFKSKGIPWRRGYTLAGVPGSGKSTLVRAIGKEFDMPIYVFDLAHETNSTFPENFQKVQASSPAIALIEDIDAVFEGRKNMTKGLNPKDSLSFDCLLNTISGVGNSDGVLLFITTNNLDKLDSALGTETEGKSSRPGRIDKILFLGLMQEPERRKLANLILEDFPEIIEEVVKLGEGETAAQFQDRCAQLALKKFWNKKNS